jgi:imidazolonepropionase
LRAASAQVRIGGRGKAQEAVVMELRTSFDRVFRNVRLLTCDPARPGLGLVEKGVVAARKGRIVYAGPESGLSAAGQSAEETGCGGRLVTPGLIDCHTHLVFAGDRAAEWEMRLAGATYEQIARAGRGILSTVKATRQASEDSLVASASSRLATLMAEGVTTVEIKSGYGLDTENEAKMLRAARRLGEGGDIGVIRTFLGAHALPPEANGDKDRYIDQVCNGQLPAIAQQKLADAVDAFCDTIGFTVEQTARVFDAARLQNLPVKLHAEQLSNCGGSKLAAKYGALSVDHIEYLDEEGVAAIRKSGTVAVLLPGAFYFLREKQKPPIEALRNAAVPMAIATDANPGSSPLTSLLLAMNMAATLFGLTVEECILGVTRNAARALGLSAEVGTLEAGKWCDLAIWDVERPAELPYRMGQNLLHRRVWRGR